MWSSQNRPALLAECRSPWPHLVNWRQLPKRDVHLPCDLADPPLGLSPAERRSRVCRGRARARAPRRRLQGRRASVSGGRMDRYSAAPSEEESRAQQESLTVRARFADTMFPETQKTIYIYIQCVHREVQMELSRAGTAGAQGARAVAEGPPTAGFLRLRSPCACGYPGVCTP